jgi:hypothetical protein
LEVEHGSEPAAPQVHDGDTAFQFAAALDQGLSNTTSTGPFPSPLDWRFGFLTLEGIKSQFGVTRLLALL